MTTGQTANWQGGTYDVAIVGGGLIGMAAARYLQREGASVVVIDRGPVEGQASRVAAGMLAPVAEAAYGEERLLAMTLASAAAYPDFIAELESEVDMRTGHMACGALHVALDRDEAAELRRRHDFLTGLGLNAELLGPSACRELEPALAPGFHGGMRVAEEAVVDPRLLLEALRASVATNRDGSVEVRVDEAVELLASGGRATGLRLAGGATVSAGHVVAAAGCWSGKGAQWLPEDLRLPVRPVKGQILELAPRTIGETVAEPIARGIVASERVYLVPRVDGRMIVGATVEEQGFDTQVTAGGVFELLREGYRSLPELAEMQLLEATVGLRPATPDNVPVIGPDPRLPGLIFATGHYRNGVLLAPLTGRAVADVVAGRPLDGPIAAADPGRFVEEPTKAKVAP